MKCLIWATVIFSLLYGLKFNKLNQIPAHIRFHPPSAKSYKPLYHFSPSSNWINDPNGLIYLEGNYHLFFQYNPFGNQWGHMSWGHAVSKDLISWKELPVAIPEFTNSDSVTTSIFSGSAIVDAHNTAGFAKDNGKTPLVAIYTSNVMRKDVQLAQHESVAYSLDKGITWKQYPGNPVLDVGSKDFRDPKVFWYQPKKKWIMLVSMATEYKVQFYESANLKNWKLLSEFGGIGNIDKVWECPDIFQLPVQGTKMKKWVLSLSAGHPEKGYLAMQYFVGNFNGEKFKADALNYPLYMDYGKDYYAGITYNNIPPPDGRVIMMGWASCWNYANDIPTGNGWRGLYAIPRELQLTSSSKGFRLMQNPIREFDSFKKVALSFRNIQVDSIFTIPFNNDSYELDFTVEPGISKVAGIKILKNKGEETVISYESSSKQLLLDRTKSGNVEFNKSFPSVEKANVSLHNGSLKVKVLVDKCIVEVFVNDGETTITDLVFPRENKGKIQLFSEGGKAIFKSVKVWNIKSVR